VKTTKAFSPAGISSFFQICDTKEDGKPLLDTDYVGARGGGFVIQKGVSTEVRLIEAEKNRVSVFINGKQTPEAETTKHVAQALLDKSGKFFDVTIKHEIEVPIGSGFGTSAAGALSTSLALSKVLELNITYNDLGRIAHAAEVRCKTGLGTVGPIMLGGCILSVEPGAPGKSVIDRIPTTEDHVIITGHYGPIPTKSVLSSSEKRTAINKWGKITLERILVEPSLENFMNCCLDFAVQTGFMTKRLQALVKLARKAGAIGAAQNMVGEAIHVLATSENVDSVVQAFKQVLPQNSILTAKIDHSGARLIG
jgi:pantoate kinase